MQIQKFKPVTPSRRHLIRLNNSQLNLSKTPKLKIKLKGFKNSSGRNHSGKITVYHKGGGVKKKYRIIDFSRKKNSSGIVISIEHDPNRSSYIASIFDFIDNSFYYIIAPRKLKVGDIVKSGLDIEPTLGSSLPISNIPIGTPVYNLSTKISRNGIISRSAGTYSVIKEKFEQFALVELSSGELIHIPLNCFATVGEVSKELFFLTRLGKAGQSRWLNKRPVVRGVAMNPIDHPHGGGEGKKSGQARTPWGKSNFGGTTRKKRKINKN